MVECNWLWAESASSQLYRSTLLYSLISCGDCYPAINSIIAIIVFMTIVIIITYWVLDEPTPAADLLPAGNTCRLAEHRHRN